MLSRHGDQPMLIPLDALIRRHGLAGIDGVLHVGAHIGEEAAAYNDAATNGHPGFANVTWIEANPDVLPALHNEVDPYGHRVIHALVTDRDGVDTPFNITNNAMSSSLLPFGTHALRAPNVTYIDQLVMPSARVDTLLEEHHLEGSHLFANLDLQGGELLCLRGAENTLERVDWLFTEINVDELYEGCVRLWELDDWLADRGFLRVDTCMAENLVNWGDALYMRHQRT